MGALVSMGEGRATNVFGKYSPTGIDIIVACNSRSGTHWMMQIVLQMVHPGQADYDYIYDIVAWPDFLPGVAIDLNEAPPPSPTGLRVIKTHAPAQSVPISDKAKYITVIRDPKEVLVSLYHWMPQAFAFLGFQTGTPDYFVEKFLKNQIPGGWWALRDKANTYITTFNDLKADAEREIDRIGEFPGIDLDTEQRQQVIEKSSFDHMKSINHKFSPIIGNTKAIDIIREGKSGTGRDIFTADHLAKVDAFCKSELIGVVTAYARNYPGSIECTQ